eukprot:UN33914
MPLRLLILYYDTGEASDPTHRWLMFSENLVHFIGCLCIFLYMIFFPINRWNVIYKYLIIITFCWFVLLIGDILFFLRYINLVIVWHMVVNVSNIHLVLCTCIYLYSMIHNTGEI